MTTPNSVVLDCFDMIRNTANAWGAVSRSFHWIILLLVAIQIPLGFWMVDVYEFYTETYAEDRLPMVMRTSMAHHTNGFLILMLATLRLGWRVSNPTPGLPANLARYQHFLARLTHVFLYTLMFVYPLTGWASLSAYEGEFPIFFGIWDIMPRIVPQVPEGATFAYEFFADIHRLCWKVGAGVLGLHAAGALWHHFVARDNILQRMLRGD